MVVCISQQALHKEMEHVREALQACNYPPLALNTLQNKISHKHNINNGQTTTGIHLATTTTTTTRMDQTNISP